MLTHKSIDSKPSARENRTTARFRITIVLSLRACLNFSHSFVPLWNYLGIFREKFSKEILCKVLEAIDLERIATLIQYFDDCSEYLLVALLPEDAKALPDEHERVTEV